MSCDGEACGPFCPAPRLVSARETHVRKHVRTSHGMPGRTSARYVRPHDICRFRAAPPRPGAPRADGGGQAVTLTSARSSTTTSAPASDSSAAWPSLSTPITRPNPPRRPASTPGERVLDHDGARRVDSQPARRLEVHRRVGLAGQAHLRGHHAVDAHLEQVRGAGDVEHHGGVLARRHEADPDPGVAQLVDQRDRGGERAHAVLAHLGVEEVVLAVAEPADGLPLRRVGRVAHRQLDAARGQEVADAVVARLAVDVEPVVGLEVERPERVGRAGRPRRSRRPGSCPCGRRAPRGRRRRAASRPPRAPRPSG